MPGPVSGRPAGPMSGWPAGRVRATRPSVLPYPSSGPLSPVRRVTGSRRASLVRVSVPARGGPEETTRGFAGACGVPLRYVVGPRTSARDRTAGDSSPVTQKGRSVPGTPGAGRNRPISRPSRPPDPPLPSPCGATPRRRPARHRRCPDTGADPEGPAPRPESRARGPFHARTTPARRPPRVRPASAGHHAPRPPHRHLPGRDARHTKILCNRYNQSRGRRVIYAATPKLEGRCTRRGVQRPFHRFGVSPSSAGPPASPGTAAAGHRRPRTGRRGTSARPPRAVRTPLPAAGACPPRPCSARRTWRAPPGP